MDYAKIKLFYICKKRHFSRSTDFDHANLLPANYLGHKRYLTGVLGSSLLATKAKFSGVCKSKGLIVYP